MINQRLLFTLLILASSFSLHAIAGDPLNGTHAVVGDGATQPAQSFMPKLEISGQQAGHLASVDPKGQVAYSIDMSLPPALLSPSLSLSYSAGSKRGFEMAFGWTINGIQEFRKSSYSKRLDYWVNPMYQASGLLSGLFEEKIFGNDTVYIQLSESSGLTRAEYNDILNQWKIYADGKAITLEDVGHQDSYRVILIEDQFGNHIDYHYDSVGRITSIEYGGSASIGHHVKVEFSYENATGSQILYVDGKSSVYNKILDKITIKTNTGGGYTRQKAYVIHNVNLGTVDVVDKITEEGQTSNASIDLASFSYQDFSDTKRNTVSLTSSLATDSISYTYKNQQVTTEVEGKTVVREMAFDANCDGLTDTLTGGNSGFKLSSTVGGPTAEVTSWEVAYMQRQGSDPVVFTNDNRVSFDGPPAALRESVIETITGSTSYIHTVSQIVDIDSDGAPDLVVSKNSGVWEVYYGNCGTGSGNPFDSALQVPAPKNYSETGYSPNAIVTPIESRGLIHTLVDINGDGKLDIFVPHTDEYYPHLKNRADGWSSTPLTTNSPFGAFEVFVYSVVDDPVETLRENKTESYFKIISRTKKSKGFADLNGDSILDAINATGTTWRVYYGMGDGYFDNVPVDWSSPFAFITDAKEAYPETHYTPWDYGLNPEVPEIAIFDPIPSEINTEHNRYRWRWFTRFSQKRCQ